MYEKWIDAEQMLTRMFIDSKVIQWVESLALRIIFQAFITFSITKISYYAN